MFAHEGEFLGDEQLEQFIKCGVWFSTLEQVKEKKIKKHLPEVAWVRNGRG